MTPSRLIAFLAALLLSLAGGGDAAAKSARLEILAAVESASSELARASAERVWENLASEANLASGPRDYPYAQVIEEYTSTPTTAKVLTATFTFADELVSQTRYAGGVPTTRFIQKDGFGSTRWLTDESAAITDTIDYDAFGVEISRTGTTPVEHLYRGERFDANIGFYDLRARLYGPGNGRFLTQDGFKGFSMDPQSLHKYVYAHSDPTNGIDPTGYFTIIDSMKTIAVGGIVNAYIGMGLNALGGRNPWGDVGKDFVIGATFAPVGGIAARAFGPVLRGLAAPVLRAVARVRPLVLTGRPGWERLLINMSRVLFRTTRGYPSVQSTFVGRTLKQLFPHLQWEQNHNFIQQAWSRLGGPRQLYDDVLANEGLRRLGHGGWNLMPIPRSLNNWLGQPGNEVAAQVFATFVYSVAVFGPYQVHEAVEAAMSGEGQ